MASYKWPGMVNTWLSLGKRRIFSVFIGRAGKVGVYHVDCLPSPRDAFTLQAKNRREQTPVKGEGGFGRICICLGKWEDSGFLRGRFPTKASSCLGRMVKRQLSCLLEIVIYIQCNSLDKCIITSEDALPDYTLVSAPPSDGVEHLWINELAQFLQFSLPVQITWLL